MKSSNVFSLGCGIIQDIKKKANFKKIKYINISKEVMLSAYYGKKLSITKNNILPVSPICTSFNIKFLKKWRQILYKFVKEIHLENFFSKRYRSRYDHLSYVNWRQ